MASQSSGESEELSEVPTSNLLHAENIHNQPDSFSFSTSSLKDGKECFESADSPLRNFCANVIPTQRRQCSTFSTNLTDCQIPDQLVTRPVNNARDHTNLSYVQNNSTPFNNLNTTVAPIVPVSGTTAVNPLDSLQSLSRRYRTGTLPCSKNACPTSGNSTQSLLQAGEQHFLSQIETGSGEKTSLKLFNGTQMSMNWPLEAANLLDVIELQSNFVQQRLEALGVPTKDGTADLSPKPQISELGEGIISLNQSQLPLSSKTQYNFPTKLLRALKELEITSCTDIASFLSDGRHFIIKDIDRFEKEVMAKYFPRMKHFASFQRQLNLYDFERRTWPEFERGAYHHHLFHRDHPELASRMRRRKIKGKPSIKSD
mmetsp:Transcript_23767/g.35091  ORF Transcript_23767/g.35091 Transcript_23767/m.35091 type:complete len:372 (+) Transcript_23767:87-1202(+)